MVFAARHLQGKCQEQHVDLFWTYVDLTKAFDTVSREGLWKIMAKYGCPRKLIAMMQQFRWHTSMDPGQRCETSGTLSCFQWREAGLCLVTNLFSLMFSTMLTDAFREGDVGIGIRCRTDGTLFNFRRLQAKPKVVTDIIGDFLLVDDCEPQCNIRSWHALQR